MKCSGCGDYWKHYHRIPDECHIEINIPERR